VLRDRTEELDMSEHRRMVLEHFKPCRSWSRRWSNWMRRSSPS
jgi:hypothetical protein